jgi:hypothetical protein
VISVFKWTDPTPALLALALALELLSPSITNIQYGRFWRSDLAQIRRWTQTQAPSALRAAIRCFLSSSRQVQVLPGDAALNGGDGLVAEIATSLPIAQSKRIK